MKLHLLADNRPLSQLRYESIARGIEAIARVHWRTRDLLRESNLDSEIFLPKNVWTQFCDLDSFENWNYSLVNVSKIVAPFTGHYMILWGRVDMGHIDSEMVSRFFGRIFNKGVPENIDEVLANDFGLISRIEKNAPGLLTMYDKLVDAIPLRFIVSTPNCMGEIGIHHHGNIVNHDTITYQSRINALYAGGVLENLENRLFEDKPVRILEIGSGHCYMAYALQSILNRRAQVFLVDLPRVLVHGFIYLAGIFGTDDIQIVTEETETIEDKPFVLIPNYLLPKMESQISNLNLTLNAISLNEMSELQNYYYLDFIATHSCSDGIFHLDGGGKYLPEHVDSLALAREKFKDHEFYPERMVNDITVMSKPNTFFKMGDLKTAH